MQSLRPKSMRHPRNMCGSHLIALSILCRAKESVELLDTDDKVALLCSAQSGRTYRAIEVQKNGFERLNNRLMMSDKIWVERDDDIMFFYQNILSSSKSID